MKRIISGIQPTNDVTLGNYLGAIKHFVELQDKYEMLIFVADLHALSSPMNLENINQNSLNIVKIYLACGLDPNKVIIFRQSDIPQHTELFDVLLNYTTIGELTRMTQYKDKSAKCKLANGTEFITTSLLTYPVLMAADILLHDAEHVIVGQDQKQHLELTRNIAERLNKKFKKNMFIIPEPLINDNGAKIMDLLDPSKKMSKSSSHHKGVIFLGDDIEIINKKIMSSLTDNFNQVKFDVNKQPGVANLMNIYAGLTNKSHQAIEEEFKDISNYGVFKSAIAIELTNLVKEIQANVKKIDDDYALQVLNNGVKKINELCIKKMDMIYKIIGVK